MNTIGYKIVFLAMCAICIALDKCTLWNSYLSIELSTSPAFNEVHHGENDAGTTLFSN